MAGQPRGGQSWWLTLPGILTAAGTVITAITGLLVVLNQAGLVGGSDSTATPSSTATGVSPPTSETAAIASPPTSEHQTSVPGTDAQGFKDYPGARCDPGNPLLPWPVRTCQRW